MKVLLDECVDSRFAKHIHTIEVHTVVGKGWAGITNGKLLAVAQAEFDVFVTVAPQSVVSTAFTQIRYCGHFAQGQIQSCQRLGGLVA